MVLLLSTVLTRLVLLSGVDSISLYPFSLLVPTVIWTSCEAKVLEAGSSTNEILSSGIVRVRDGLMLTEVGTSTAETELLEKPKALPKTVIRARINSKRKVRDDLYIYIYRIRQN